MVTTMRNTMHRFVDIHWIIIVIKNALNWITTTTAIITQTAITTTIITSTATATTSTIIITTTVMMSPNNTWLCSVNPDSHSDHQARGVLVKDDIRRRGSAQSGLGKSSLLQLRAVTFRGRLSVSGIRSVDRSVRATSIISESESLWGLSAENRDVRCTTSIDRYGSRGWRFRVVAAVASVVVVVAGRGFSAVRGWLDFTLGGSPAVVVVIRAAAIAWRQAHTQTSGLGGQAVHFRVPFDVDYVVAEQVGSGNRTISRVNFTKVLRAAFMYVSCACRFFVPTF